MIKTEIFKYNFSEEFTRYPGPRFKRLGKYSGEEFRDDILKPLLENNELIEIDASNIRSFNPSFLDEVFSYLAEELGLEEFKKRINFYSTTDKNLEKKMMSYVLNYLNKDN